MSTFSIGFWELVFLAEACIPPCPPARSAAWANIIDTHYHRMNEYCKNELYSIMSRKYAYQEALKQKVEEVLLFDARFNPKNQFLVECEDQTEKTFLWKEKYHTHTYRHIHPPFIKKIMPLYP